MVMQKLEFGWFIPTRGDTDDYGQPLKVAAGLEMFDRVSVAAERAGFEYMGFSNTLSAPLNKAGTSSQSQVQFSK